MIFYDFKNIKFKLKQHQLIVLISILTHPDFDLMYFLILHSTPHANMWLLWGRLAKMIEILLFDRPINSLFTLDLFHQIFL